MILADTSIWIEFFRKKNPAFLQMRNQLEENQIVVHECIFAELLQGAKNETERSIVTEYWLNLPKISGENILLEAGLESGRKKWFTKGVGLVDAALITAARSHKVSIWTLDKKLKSLLLNKETFTPGK
jgi:predicted nucleic acid-binding protein